MASVTIRHHWPDNGGLTEIRIHIDASYPDAINEARINARGLLREVVADLTDTDDD